MGIYRKENRGLIRSVLGSTLFAIQSLYFIVIGYAGVMTTDSECHLSCAQAHEIFWSPYFGTSLLIACASLIVSMGLIISGFNAAHPHEKISW